MKIQSKLKQAAILSAMSIGLASPIMAAEDTATEATEEEVSTKEKGKKEKKKLLDTTAKKVCAGVGAVILLSYNVRVGYKMHQATETFTWYNLNPFTAPVVSPDRSTSDSDSDLA
jgi:hypothetical protein